MADSAGAASKLEGAAPVRQNNRATSLISGIHYSSFPGYTRVTVDLQMTYVTASDPDGPRPVNLQPLIKFESQHLSHPDRVYFDLPDSKLAAGLNGKTIRVDDDFVSRIRVAQFARGRSRIVLEVNGESACDASVLADPPRMVIYVRKETGRGQVAADRMASGDANMTMPLSQDPPVATTTVRASSQAFGRSGSGAFRCRDRTCWRKRRPASH